MGDTSHPTRSARAALRPLRRRLARPGLALLLAVLPACRDASAPASPTDPRPGAAAFDVFWRDVDRTYPYFAYKGVDWNAGRDALRERAAVATTDSALVAVLRDAVAPLRDVHAWFTRPDGSVLPSYVPTRAPNWDSAVWQSYLAALGWRQQVANWGWGRVEDVGYLAIGAWNPSQVRIAELDGALEQLRSTRALVLDVRANGGGSDGVALQLAARFAASPLRFGAVRYRAGPGHADLGAWTDRILSPRGPWRYAAPVYLLVGPLCFSSNETFIAAMRELPNVTVVGDTTGGGSGNPREFPLVVAGRDTRWRYWVPQWIEAIADGTIIEWNGIPADVRIPWDATAAGSAPGARDPVLEGAFALAGVSLTR